MFKKHLVFGAFSAALVSLLAPQGQASGIYSTYSLNASGSSGEVFNGVDGWSQSEANYSADYPRAYIQPFSGGVTGFAVGGFYDTEPFTGGNALTVSQTLVGNLARGATLNATFQMQDSSVVNDPNDAASGYFDVDRNQFSIGLGDFVSLVLQPASQSSDPGNDNALWNPFISVGGELRPITGAQVQEGGSYTFSVTLDSSAGGLTYDASLTDFGGTAILSSGSIPGVSAADLLTSVDVGWSLAGTEVDGLGSNSIAISSLALRAAQEQAGTLFSTYSLNASGASGEVFNGVDGWSQSEANFSADYPRAYVQPFSGGVTGFAVGGFYDTESFTGGNSLTVSQTLVGNLARGATLDATFQMQDSSVLNDPNNPASGYFDVDRNQFSIGLGDFVSLVLQPASQSSDPENDNALWNPFISVGGELRPITGAQVQEGGSYTFSVTLASSAGGLTYDASLTDFGGTAILSSGSIPGASSTDLLASVDVGWSLAGTEVDGLGSNSIAISSLSLRAAQEQSGTSYSLNTTGSSGEVLNEVDGWSQSEANFSEDYPRAYIQPFSGGVTGFAVGGFYDTEAFTGGDSLTVSQSLGGRLASGTTLNATFQMQDSSVLIDPTDAASGYFDVDRNQFSIGLGGIVSLVLQPASQSSDPGNDIALWNPFISVGGELRPITGAQVQEGGSYTFSVTLTSSASGLDYNASLTDFGGTSISSSGSIPGSSATALLTTADVGWSLAGTEVDGLGSNSIAISSFSVSIPASWESLQPRFYAGTAVDLLPGQPDSVVRYQLPATVDTPASFSNIPAELDLSYLSVHPGSQQVSAMGNLVEGDSGAESYVHAVNAVLVTHAQASDWPEWAARDSSGYSHEVEASIWEVERNGAGVLTGFEPLIASRSLVHVPWRPTETADGSPYPYSGYAFEVTIPFVESTAIPDEYVVLISYNTESEGPNPLGVAGPYNSLNYGLSRSEVSSGTDADPNSLIRVTPQGWNYSPSWGSLRSLMMEVVSRSVDEMGEIPSDQPARVGAYLTAVYEGGTFVEQATVMILPRPITLTASPQERFYGETLVLDETAFSVADVDGDSTLPNGEVIDTVALNSAAGVNTSITANVGIYADEIAITGQSGSNGFDSNNYDLSYMAGDLAVVARGPTFYSLYASGSSGDVFNGVDGWSQSEANFSADYPRAYVQPFSGGVTGFAVGGFYDTEPFTGGNTLTVSQSLGVRLASGATLNATFQMQDSGVLIDPNDPASGYFDVDRNQFSIGLGDFVSLVLQPASQSSDPANDTALWNPFISVGGELRPITGAQVQEGGSYTFSVALASSAGGLTYNASLTDSGGTAVLSSGSIPGSSSTDLLTTTEVGWSLAGTEVDGLGSNSIAISSFSVRTSEELEWESLRPWIYAGTPVDLLPGQPESVVRYQLPATVETPASFSNIPDELDLSYLSIHPGSQEVSAMGNLVEGDSGAESYVHAVNAVLVTHAQASDWPEWAARDSSGYSHEVEVSIWEVERNGAGVLTTFEPWIASRSLVHVPWRPTKTADSNPYPYSGYAFEVTIPFVESAVLPDEYVVLISYNTESEGPNPLGVAGPYNSLNYGLSQSEVSAGTDPDPSSQVQVTPQGWNYSSSWGTLDGPARGRSIMTEVVSRSVAELEEIPSDQPARVGEYLTAYYEGSAFVQQATVEILPRRVTLTASQQERNYGDTMVLDGTAFTVTDLDGDSTLPNGEVIDAVVLTSLTGVDGNAVANVGVYADEIEITGQAGSNGFDADNYDLTYVAGDLAVTSRNYEAWIQGFLETVEIEPLDDRDLDGLTNLMEYALGTNPIARTNRQPFEVSEDGVFSGQISAELVATTVVFESSVDLQNWVEFTPEFENDGLFTSWEWSGSGEGRAFVRLRVVRTP